jgi:hypothetical protein
MLLLLFLGLLCVLFLPPTCATKRALRDLMKLWEQISNKMAWHTLWVRRILAMGEEGDINKKEEKNGIIMNKKAIAVAARADWGKSQGLTIHAMTFVLYLLRHYDPCFLPSKKNPGHHWQNKGAIRHE